MAESAAQEAARQFHSLSQAGQADTAVGETRRREAAARAAGGNKRRLLWKRACRLLASQEQARPMEKLIYGTLGGEPAHAEAHFAQQTTTQVPYPLLFLSILAPH